jgi:hypothetical protein
LISILFCQFAKSQSRRDIRDGLKSAIGNLIHLGIRKAPSKSTLGFQNKNRNWELFRDYCCSLLESLGQQAGFKQVKFRIKSKISLLDATTICLCLSLFDWAKYKTAKEAVKRHTLLDFDGNSPPYVNVTDGKTVENKGAYDIPLLKGSMIVIDRFNNDFYLLNVWDSKGVCFMVRHKDNTQYIIVKKNELPENRHEQILKDKFIQLTGIQSKKKYPKRLRRLAIWEDENGQVIEVMTNQMSWTANTISELYKSPWQVEIFFREIKQLLHIKSFIAINLSSA